MPPKLTEAHYHALAKSRGFIWLGKELPTTQTYTLWRCQNGHEFEAKYEKLYMGRGCPTCGYKNRVNWKRIKEADYYALAHLRGFAWIGKQLPTDNKEKTHWTCSQGHEFTMAYHDMQQGDGCVHCSGLAKKTANDYHNLASQYKLTWVGKVVPKSIAVKTQWRCAQGHEFLMRYNNVQQGQGCSKCREYYNGAPTSKPQRAIHALLGGSLNYTVGIYNIDIAIAPATFFQVAVEYDSWYWHQKRTAHDTARDKYLHARGWRILRIKSNVLIPTLSELQDAIERLRAGETYLEIILPDWKTNDAS